MKTVKVLWSLCFGIAAFLTCAGIAFEVMGIPTGPDSGPIIAIMATAIGLGASVTVYPKIEAMLNLLGVHGELTATKMGRLSIVASAAFAVLFIFAVAHNENYLFLSFVPPSLVFLALVVRWILGGDQPNA